MEEYVDEILSTTQRLADINQPIDDEFVGVIMLSGLPAEYDPLVMAIENSSAKISSDFIKSKLINEIDTP